MISRLATSSNWIVYLRNMRSKVKLLQLCILIFIKLGIHVPTKLVTSISLYLGCYWIEFDLKLELKQILNIHLYHLQIISFAYS